MMSSNLQQRFDQLLTFAKDPSAQIIARENIAAARELVDTLLSVGIISCDDYRAYQAQVTSAQLVISARELKPCNRFDGSRAPSPTEYIYSGEL